MIDSFFAHLRELTNNLGEPAHLTEKELGNLLAEILEGKNERFALEDPDSAVFYLCLNIKKQAFIAFDKGDVFVPGIAQALGHAEKIDFRYFLEEVIHEDLLADYLLLGMSAYEEAKRRVDEIVLLKHSFNEIIYLKSASGKTYVAIQTAYPVQLDDNKFLISHLNKYQVLLEKKGKTEIGIDGVMKLDGEEVTEFTESIYRTLAEIVFKMVQAGVVQHIGMRAWEILQKYLILSRSGQEKVTSEDITEAFDTHTGDHGPYTSDIIRKDMKKVKDWVNENFHLSDSQNKLKSTDEVIAYLFRNSYFKDLSELNA